MKLVTKTPSYAVYDDVFPAPAFQRIWQYVQRENYQWVHQQMWLKAWRLGDGSPLAGPVLFSNEETARVANNCPKGVPLPEDAVRNLVFPTRRPIDGLIEAFQEYSEGWTDLIGHRDREWVGFTVRAFLYPQGAGLSWHLDLGRYSGAYIYYAHPQWNVKWGGELMIADDPARDQGGSAHDPHDPATASIYQPDKGQRFGQHLDNAWENERLLEVGTGRYIFPKPNRLVIVALGCAHCINPVSKAAGDNSRATITGFFIAPSEERAARSVCGAAETSGLKISV